MKIVTNGDPQTLDSDTVSIAEILKINHVEMPEMVSVQLNGDFVERDSFDTTTVKEGDEVDLLYFMGGGSL
jgi:sulfur carrier protein